MSSTTRATEGRVGRRLGFVALARREEDAVDAVLDLRRDAHPVGEGHRRRAAPERLAHDVAVRLAERRVHEDVGVAVEVGIVVHGTSPVKKTRFSAPSSRATRR